MAVIKNGLLVLASMLLCLMVLEFGLRVINGQPFLPDRNLLLERVNLTHKHLVHNYDPLIGWGFISNVSFSPESQEKSWTTGELGVRMNQARILPIPQQAILAVGDSFTAGAEVGDVETWPAWLERKIGEPVVNAAVGGWATDQMILRAEDLIPKLAPKTIIVSALEDDILRTAFRVHYGGPKPYFLVDNNQLVHMNNPVPRTIEGASKEIGLVRTILGYSYLVDWMMSRLQVESWIQIIPYVSVETDPSAVTCLLLERLKRETDAKGIRLIFAMQWDGDLISQTPNRPTFAVRTLDCAHDAGIQTVDTWGPLKAVRAQGEDKLKALYVMAQNGTSYGHMSSSGNQFIAELMAKALSDRNFTAAANPEVAVAMVAQINSLPTPGPL